MANIFPKRHPCSKWGGYKFEVFANEPVQDKSKRNREAVHIHVIKIGGTGNIRVFIQDNLRINEKYESIKQHEYGAIKDFIQKKIDFIKKRVKEEYEKTNFDHLVD